MAKLYIFGIGGTGSRVLRSLIMLLASGVKCDIDEVVPVIIDPDNSNADLTRSISLINLYSSIRSKLTFNENNENLFFRRSILKKLNNYTLRINDTDDKKFKQFIDFSSMKRENQAMMKMLFSDDNLNSSMDIGFKGNPNIGSVVLNQIVNSKEFVELTNSFAEGDKIFIISSIFGGTGASGFPLLLKTLRTGNFFPNYNIINNAEIGSISILPYFKLEPNEESSIDSSTFISKTKSALAYYENNICKNGSINSMYYLADDVSGTYKNHDGGSEQINDAHLIEFLAATAIVDFANTSSYISSTSNKEFGLKDITESVSFNSFYDKDKKILYCPLTQFMLLSNCLTDKFDYFSSSKLNANYKCFNNFYDSPFISELKDFCKKYKEWFSEMKSNKRSLDLFNLNCGDKPFEVVTGVKPTKIASMKSDYYLVASRLNANLMNCVSKSNEDKFLEMYFLATRLLIKEKINKV